jgi:extradiol dioxygenase family protein
MLDHLSLPVLDLDESLRYYSAVLEPRAGRSTTLFG